MRVHSLAVCIAACSSSFHRCATSFARGSSGFGAPRRACIDNKMVRICKAGDQLPMFVSWLVIKTKGHSITLEDIETDPAKLVNIWVVDLCQEADFGRSHWIVVG